MIEYRHLTNNQNKVYRLGPFVVDSRYATNSYLIQTEKFNILVDITPIQIIDLLKIAIQKHIDLSSLTHVIIQNMTMSHINSLIDLIDEGFKGKLITNKFFARQIINANLPIDILLIEDLKYKLLYNSKAVLHFIPMIFLPFPEMFMTYIPSESVLFSSTLFSSFFIENANASIDFIQKQIFLFHKAMIPSSEYMKSPIRSLSNLNIDQIFPLYGYTITNQIVAEILNYVKMLDFYNTDFIYKQNDVEVKEVNYIEIINHMIQHLQSRFSRIELLNIFVGSPFSLDNETLQLKKSSLHDRNLWNGFFEHIFIRKGLKWLSILEPKVLKYTNEYGVDIPSIYRSNILSISKQAEELDKKRDELVTEVGLLTDQMKQINDRLLRCPITSLYIQDVLKELLINSFKQELPKGKVNGLILVQLNQLNDFNRRYGKETGDESIRNLTYIIEQVKSEKAIVFKQTGPGILVYIDQADENEIHNEALKIRNEIHSSELFIEKVTSSISIVLSEETELSNPSDIKVKEMFKLLEKRMIVAKKASDGEIIDKSSENIPMTDGVVLLVDEDEISLNMLLRIFKRINFTVLIAQSSIEAIEILRKSPIDVIISEINLSKIDGFALKHMLNETQEFKTIPFVMVSHNKTLANIKRGNALDVDVIIEKPIIPDELIGFIKRFRDRKGNL